MESTVTGDGVRLTNTSVKKIGEEMSLRVARLRDQLIRTVPEISPERVRVYTESYAESSAEPMILRRAKALTRMLESMSLYILDGEIIVGNTSRHPRGVELFPEYEVEWIERELDGDPVHFSERPGDRFDISDETRGELKTLLPRWHGKTHSENVRSVLTSEVNKAWEMGAIDSGWLLQGGDGHITVNLRKLLLRGVNGLIEEIDDARARLDMTEPDSLDHMLFYDASKMTLRAVIGYANRYADYAREIAGREEDPDRKRELLDMASVCDRVPAGPARTLHEALQSIWFVQAVIQIETNGHSISFGRLDQTLHPYLSADLAEGRITYDRAAELLQCFWLKLFTANKIRDWESTRFFIGYQVFENITIGGQLYGGRDAANDLTFLMLGVQKALRLAVPSLSFRYYDGTGEELMQAVIDVVKVGGGQPALYSDETVIPAIVNRGIDYGDAVNWSVVGCVEPIVEGKQAYRPNGAAFVSILKILELVLRGGRDPRTGHDILHNEHDLTEMESFDELKERWEEAAKYFVRLQVEMDNIIDLSMEKNSPNPFVSSFVDDCIARGKTVKQGGAVYDYCGPLVCGVANVGDSLAALRKIVFEDRALTGEQVLHALNTDFGDQTTTPTGAEIRAMLLDAPKYGNDDDYVDSLTADALDLFCRELPRYKTTRYGRGPKGGIWHSSCSTVSGNIPFGMVIGATPDGRKAGTPTADTTSPTQGMDRKGPLSTMKSVGKIPNLLSSGGNLFNMKFSPLVLQDEAGRMKFSSLIRAFLGDLKGMHVQFNIVDGDLLRDARKTPEKYPDLMVRVAGYSALFTAIDPKLQDDIINRTEQLTI
jgi:pyruvate formate-lyase/glycerol dehydratase family glycyl radical enzyme